MKKIFTKKWLISFAILCAVNFFVMILYALVGVAIIMHLEPNGMGSLITAAIMVVVIEALCIINSFGFIVTMVTKSYTLSFFPGVAVAFVAYGITAIACLPGGFNNNEKALMLLVLCYGYFVIYSLFTGGITKLCQIIFRHREIPQNRDIKKWISVFGIVGGITVALWVIGILIYFSQNFLVYPVYMGLTMCAGALAMYYIRAISAIVASSATFNGLVAIWICVGIRKLENVVEWEILGGFNLLFFTVTFVLFVLSALMTKLILIIAERKRARVKASAEET